VDARVKIYIAIPPSIKPRAWLDDERHLFDSISVIEERREPQRTGLYDASGNELYRVPNKNPCGFIRLNGEGG